MFHGLHEGVEPAFKQPAPIIPEMQPWLHHMWMMQQHGKMVGAAQVEARRTIPKKRLLRSKAVSPKTGGTHLSTYRPTLQEERHIPNVKFGSFVGG